jgi:hypothetical protein
MNYEVGFAAMRRGKNRFESYWDVGHGEIWMQVQIISYSVR